MVPALAASRGCVASEARQPLQPLPSTRESDLVVLVEQEEEQEEQQHQSAYAGGENRAEELVWKAHDTPWKRGKKKKENE